MTVLTNTLNVSASTVEFLETRRSALTAGTDRCMASPRTLWRSRPLPDADGSESTSS